ncbi:MAG: histidine kinase N-terminal 7TM domain-containing protein, partial [Methanomassiliicoccales archaeon]
AFYCYGLLIASAALIIRSMMGVNPIYKNQGAILLLGMSIPALAEALAYVDVTGQDFAPCFFGVSGVIYAIGLYSYRLLDIRPLARGEIMENMTDAVLVIDTEDRLVDFNRVASSKLFKRMPNPAGSFIFDAVSFDPDFIERYYGEEIFHREVTLKDIEVMNTFDVSIMPLLYKDQIRGRMILMRDISDRKYMEDTLHIYNIGRQNLLNKIDEIEKHLASVRSDQVSKESKDHLESMNDLLRSTRSLVSFFNDNEDLKAHAPKWHDVGELIRCAKGRLDLGNVRVESRVNGLFIYGDALMERVFFILMENSLRHERQVSTITVDYQDRPDHMSIIYEDDGTESPMADTPGIFDCQFGTKTRSVLFLTREILAISDIKITECGEPRKGARFELDIPHDACLFNTKT